MNSRKPSRKHSWQGGLNGGPNYHVAYEYRMGHVAMTTILHPLVYVTLAVCGTAILGWFVVCRWEHWQLIKAEFQSWLAKDTSTPRYIYDCECDICKSVRTDRIATNVRAAARSYLGPAVKAHRTAPTIIPLSHADRDRLVFNAIVRGRVN
jgi:hypothetical protein